MMCVPLLGLDGNPMGIINIDTQNPLSQFQNDDLDLLMAVAGQAALSYESARLLVTYMEKQKQDAEMDIARSVQRALLPDQMPQADGYDFFASYEACKRSAETITIAFCWSATRFAWPSGTSRGRECRRHW